MQGQLDVIKDIIIFINGVTVPSYIPSPVNSNHYNNSSNFSTHCLQTACISSAIYLKRIRKNS